MHDACCVIYVACWTTHDVNVTDRLIRNGTCDAIERHLRYVSICILDKTTVEADTILATPAHACHITRSSPCKAPRCCDHVGSREGSTDGSGGEARAHCELAAEAFREALRAWREERPRLSWCEGFLRHARCLAARARRSPARFARRLTERERGHAARYGRGVPAPLEAFVPGDEGLLRLALLAARRLRAALRPPERASLLGVLSEAARGGRAEGEEPATAAAGGRHGLLELLARLICLPLCVYVGDTVHMLRLFARMQGLKHTARPTSASVTKQLGVFAGVAFATVEAARLLFAAFGPDRLWEVLSLESSEFLGAHTIWARGLWLGEPSRGPDAQYNFASFSLWLRGTVDVLEVHRGEAEGRVPCLLVAPAAMLRAGGALPARLFAEVAMDGCALSEGVGAGEKEVILPPFAHFPCTPVPPCSVLEMDSQPISDAAAEAWLPQLPEAGHEHEARRAVGRGLSRASASIQAATTYVVSCIMSYHIIL